MVMDASGNVSRSYPLPSNPHDWMVANVTGDGHWDLFVTSLGSGPHTAHMFALDGLSGEVLWEKDWGPYAGVVGVGDYDQDGLEDAFVREHFDLYVVLSPSGEEKKGTSICGYHAPILTDIESDGMTDIVWGGGWGSLPVDKVWYFENQFGTFRYLNKRWVQLFGGGDSDEVYTKMPAVGDVDGDGIKEVAAGNKNGTIHCFDGDKGGLQWDYFVGSNPSDIVSCDIDSDGLDEFIFGTGDGRLVVLGEGGNVEWAVDFGDPVGDVAICDLDRDTKADLLVPVMDGHVYFLHIPELPALCVLWIVGGWISWILLCGRSRPFQRTHK